MSVCECACVCKLLLLLFRWGSSHASSLVSFFLFFCLSFPAGGGERERGRRKKRKKKYFRHSPPCVEGREGWTRRLRVRVESCRQMGEGATSYTLEPISPSLILLLCVSLDQREKKKKKSLGGGAGRAKDKLKQSSRLVLPSISPHSRSWSWISSSPESLYIHPYIYIPY